MGYNYKRIRTEDSNNPRYDKYSGCVAEHILVVEKIFGRYLKREEVVHHIDENIFNNNPNNLRVFATSADHSRFHTGVYKELSCKKNVWVCIKEDIFCSICKKTMSRKVKNDVCRSCFDKNNLGRRVKDRPSKDELYKLLKENSFTKIGEKYGVSCNAIRKWCKLYNISYKSSYYRSLKD